MQNVRNLAKVPTDTQTPPTGVVEWGRAQLISSRLPHVSVIIPLLIVYACLATYRIDSQSMWVDEVVSVRVASDEHLFSPVIWFRQSPLYFALLHLWMQLGTGEAVLRFLSVIFGGIAVCITYVLGVRLFDRRVAWIGATILATSPFLIWYSQEVRYITLMIAASLFSMYAFHRAVASDRRGWWFSYGISLVVAAAAFVSNVLLPVVQGLYIAFSPSHRHLWRKVLACQLVFFGVFIWWGNGGQLNNIGGRWEKVVTHITASNGELSSLPRTERLSSGGNRDFEPAAIPYTFFTFSTGFSAGPSVRELQVSRSLDAIRPHLPLVVTLGLLFGGLFITGLISVWRRRDAGFLLMVWLAGPIIGASLVSAFTDMAYNVRYVAMVLPAYILILAAGVSAVRRPAVRMTLLASVLLVSGFSMSNHYFNPRYAREDARDAAQYLESAAAPEDVILVVGNSGGLQYYYKGDVPIVTWPRNDISDDSGIRQRLTELAGSHERLWLVEIRPWEKDRAGNVKAALEKLYGSVQHRHFPGVEIRAYDL